MMARPKLYPKDSSTTDIHILVDAGLENFILQDMKRLKILSKSSYIRHLLVNQMEAVAHSEIMAKLRNYQIA